ncbi:hypothetical protein ABMA28_009753 [Loxostege sticticalis]|uniref:Cytochrome P450 n=1 Tax=Loxostege sticticalis TaxID=481309 RepID=A0ABD0SDF4_LOXSC
MFVLLFSFVLLCWLVLRRGKLKGSLPPVYPGCIPIIGHAHLLVGDGKQLWNLIQYIQRDCLKNGGVTLFRLGPEKYYVICDPDDYITVMGVCLEKNYFYRKILNAWVGEGLVTAPVSVWKKHQKLLYPAFGQPVVDSFIGVQNSQARRLVNRLGDLLNKGPFEHLDYIARSALETNLLTVFGLEQNMDTMSYMKYFVEIRRIMTKRLQNCWMHNDFFYSWTDLKKQQDEALKKLRALSDEIIQRKRRVMKDKQSNVGKSVEQGKQFKGFMDLILESSASGALSDADIRAQVDTMVLAGFDTTSTTMAYACMLIGSYPAVQEKVYAELEEVFEGLDRDVERGDLSRLVYLDAVLKEVGRLYPAAPVVIRYLDKDVKLQNYTMPAGSNCVLLISGLNRHQVWGSDREEFRPERWLETASLPENSNAFTGFSTGRRACIGKPYAVTLMKITLAHLLRHYRIKADHRHLVLQLEIFLKPAEGCQISLEPRHVKMV